MNAPSMEMINLAKYFFLGSTERSGWDRETNGLMTQEIK